MESTVM